MRDRGDFLCILDGVHTCLTSETTRYKYTHLQRQMQEFARQRHWQRSLRNLFALAGIENGHAHRFRDTFAVELLLTGTSIEEVAVLLGHSNIKVTQKHYNPWVLKRQKLLESNVERSWRDDPILLAMGTRRVRREGSEKPNLFIIGGKEVVPAGGIEPTA
jgi:hypothetical protein